jgi:hypothetical protein
VETMAEARPTYFPTSDNGSDEEEEQFDSDLEDGEFSPAVGRGIITISRSMGFGESRQGRKDT